MSVAIDPMEARYMEELEKLRPINEARARDGLPPLSPGVRVEDYETRMFYAGAAPWNVGLGAEGSKVGVEEPQTSAEAIKLAGLNWRVALTPVYTGIGGGRTLEIPGWQAVVRDTDGAVLGMSDGGRYVPIQNEEQFAFMDNLVEDRVMRYVTAGQLYGGRVVWMLAKMDEDLRIAGDIYEDYLLCTSGHDLKHSMMVLPTRVRVVCRNTLKMATGSAGFSVRITHMGNTAAKMAKAKEVLAITTEQQRRYQEWLERLAETKMDEEQVVQVRDGLFGTLDDATPARRRESIARWLEILDAEETREGQTAYATLQAVTGFGDHEMKLRERQNQPGAAQMMSFLGGPGDAFKRKGIAVLETVSGVALADVH